MNALWLTIFLMLAATLNAAAPSDPDLERTRVHKYESSQSPNRRFVALSGVGLSDVSPSIRMRLRILIVSLDRADVQQILPWVRPPFAVTWSAEDVLLVCGRSDDTTDAQPLYRTSAFHLDSFGRVESRALTPEEHKELLAAFEAKHGFRPSRVEEESDQKPNQPPQLNAGSRPSSDDSSASETPSSLGPRG